MDADDTPTPESDDHIILTTPEEAFAELADLNDAPDGTETPPGATSEDPDVDTTEPWPSAEVAPPVVAVVVVHNAGEWLDELLGSLGDQTYANLSVLVIDADSDIDPTPRVAQTLPGAFVRRLEHNVGYGPTLNEILELVSGASFYALCHDDVALDPDCIHELVAEAFRSNAGIVGPKLVDWDDPELLLSVGFTIDKSAGRAPYAERHELDQGQHDAVRDVFAVTGGCTLIRSDLFGHLGGFDPGIDLLGEDLDLCWRAHLVGARVVVAPRARARHREALADRVDATRLTRVDAAHRMRTVLSNSRLLHLVILIPQLAVISLVEAIVELAIGRRSHARAQVSAWGSTLRSAPSIVRSRRRVKAIRERDDRSIGRLQTKSWARLDGLVQANRRAQAESHDTLAAPPTEDEVPLERGTLDDADGFVRTGAARRRYSTITWAVLGLVAVLVVGTRELFFGSLPAVGAFADAPHSLSELWHIWWGSWNPVGLGSENPPASGLGPMALGGSLLGGAFGLLRRLAILLPIPIGLLGAWRVPRLLGSRRAQLVSLLVYAAVPVPWNSLAQGSWGGLLVYAAAPWILQCAVWSMHLAPFASTTDPDDAPGPSRWWARVLGFGLLLAVVGTLVPAVVGVAVVLAVGLVVGSLLLGRVGGLGRLVTTTLGAVAVAALLNIPWTFVGPARSVWSLAGLGGGVHGWLDLGAILRFESGPMGAGLVGYAFLVAAALPLVIGRSWRFAWAVRAWVAAGACFTVVWLGQQDWFGIPVPAPEVFLAPAAISLALAAACGVVAFEVDLPTFGFGFAQAASLVAAAAVTLSMFPLLGNATDGRWQMAPVGLDDALSFITTQRSQQPFRIVWVGDPSVVPVAGWSLDEALSVGITNDGMPQMTELWAPADPGGSGAVLDALDMAMRSETARAGSVLADMDVRYVVLPRQGVPLPYRSTAHRPPTRLLDALEDQLDLARVSANDAVVVYRNEAWRAGPEVLPAATPVGTSLADALDVPAGEPAKGRIDPTRTSRIVVPSAGILTTGLPADDSWRLTVDGKAAEPVTLWGWEQGFEVTGPGTAELTRSGGAQRPLVAVAMFVVWFVVVLAWILGRRRRSADDLVPDDVDDGTGGGSFVRLDSTDPDRGAVEVEQIEIEPVDVESDGDEPEGES